MSIFTPRARHLCLAVATALAAMSAQTALAATSVATAAESAIAIEPAARPFNLQTRVVYWSKIALNASGQDHTNTPDVADQFGPHRSSRAMAISHIALFDALNTARGGKYNNYSSFEKVRGNVSADAAIAQAVYETLVVLYPKQVASFEQLLAQDLAAIPHGPRAKANGIELGKRAAAAILAQRSADGSQYVEPIVGTDYFPGNEPGQWRQDPVLPIPFAIGQPWGNVTPFAVENVATDYRLPPHPAIDSPEYVAYFNDVKDKGGDGIVTPTLRTADETIAGIYWAYDGVPTLCAPPRLYNQVAMAIADSKRLRDPLEYARMLGLINVAMADAAIVAWNNKWHYNLWRPVGAVREADAGTGPTGLGDGNDATVGDVNWTPLGGPATNSHDPNFTPPFPAYPSGHATIGGALFQTLRLFFGTDNAPFTFVSDEFNGQNVDNQGNTRPLIPRSFGTISEAEAENARSRIYLGVHFQFDADQGVAYGNRVGNYVFSTKFTRK